MDHYSSESNEAAYWYFSTFGSKHNVGADVSFGARRPLISVQRLADDAQTIFPVRLVTGTHRG